MTGACLHYAVRVLVQILLALRLVQRRVARHAELHLRHRQLQSRRRAPVVDRRRPRRPPARSLLAVGSREEQFRALLRRDHGRANLGLLLLTGLALPLLLKVCADPDGLRRCRRSLPRSARRRSRRRGACSSRARRIGRLPRCRQPHRPCDRRRGARRARRERRRIGGALRRHRGAALAALLLALWFGGASAARRDLRSRRAGGELSAARGRRPPLRLLVAAVRLCGLPLRPRRHRQWLAVTASASPALPSPSPPASCCSSACCAAMLNERNRRPPPPIRCPIHKRE